MFCSTARRWSCPKGRGIGGAGDKIGHNPVLVPERSEVAGDHLVGLLAERRPFVEEVSDLVPERPTLHRSTRHISA